MRRGGGIITHEDLRSYQPIEREPVRGTYRGYDDLSMPPSSSGGITIMETLNMLEDVRQPRLRRHASDVHRRRRGVPARVHRPQRECSAIPAFVHGADRSG